MTKTVCGGRIKSENDNNTMDASTFYFGQENKWRKLTNELKKPISVSDVCTEAYCRGSGACAPRGTNACRPHPLLTAVETTMWTFGLSFAV